MSYPVYKWVNQQVAVSLHPPSHCASPPVAPRGAAWRRSTADRCRWRRRSDRCRGPASCNLGGDLDLDCWDQWPQGFFIMKNHHSPINHHKNHPHSNHPWLMDSNGWFMGDFFGWFLLISEDQHGSTTERRWRSGLDCDEDQWGSMRQLIAIWRSGYLMIFHATAEDLPVENYQ